jgi:UDP-2,3-diacylglucosamine hydrolase
VSVLFASDVHLSARRPGRVRDFIAFLGGPCRRAHRLVLLGDIFDEWLGDDDRRSPHPEVIQALAALSNAGVRVDFCWGNHDFLVGEAFYVASGTRPLADGTIVSVHGTEVVALHGDTLCTRDEDYQRWRATFTDPAMQRQFLALPFAARVERAAALRHGSMQATRLKPDDIMDVTPAAVCETLEALGARHMVHGHTHRPGIHCLDMPAGEGKRIVLGDWYAGEQILRWDEAGPALGTVAELFPA